MTTISTRVLLGIYAVIPVIVLLMFADSLFFGGAIKHILPHFPEEILWYMLLFNFPHIIASFFSFADKEYIAHYKYQLLRGLPIIALLAIALPFLSITATVIILVLYTMYHNISQQTGIASILMQHRDKWTQAWRWSLISFGLFLYVLVYPSPLSLAVTSRANSITMVFLVVTLLLTMIVTRQSKTLIGKWYAIGTMGIAATGTCALYMGYPIITITILRIVHDITAFIFYITHDTNRNQKAMHNFFYRKILPNVRAFPIGIPLLGIFFTYIIQGGGVSTTIEIFFFVAVTHFYIEGFMWKAGSPHRANIGFS